MTERIGDHAHALPGFDSNGQFDHHDPAFVADPWSTYQQVRTDTPVLRSERHGGFWLVSTYRGVNRVALDWKAFTSAVPGVLLIPSGLPRTLPFIPLELDPPEHTAYRALLRPALSARRIATFADPLGRLARDLLDSIVANAGGDIPADFSEPMSSTALAWTAGLPESDRDLWVGLVARAFSGQILDKDDAAAAAREFREYIFDLISQRRRARVGDLLSDLIDADVDGVSLDDETLFGFIQLLLVAGHETTASAISYTFRHLIEHPEHVEQLRQDRRLIPLAVEEFVRLASPVSIFARNATDDIQFEGQPISRGDIVGMSFSSANRDPEQFDRPEEAILNRSPNPHLAFGTGVHVCLGAPLARLELATSISAFLDTDARFQLRGEPEWKTRGDALSLKHLSVSVA